MKTTIRYRMTMNKLKSSVAGKRKKWNGQANESMIAFAFTTIFRKFGDLIEKTPEPLRVIKTRPNGHVEAFFEARAQPDYKGALATQGGRAFVAEAKSTTGASLPFSLVKRHQILALRKYANTGAAAAVIATIRDETFLVPLDDWLALPERIGRKSARAQDLARWRWVFVRGIPRF